jgi:pSer/pThr/pTyr-binding forkhead associated (FHA) protein
VLRRPQRAQVTRTISKRVYVDDYVGPVLAFRRLPDGPVFVLDDFVNDEGEAKVTLAVGSDRSIDIPLVADDTISEVHCLIKRDDEKVFVYDAGAKNGTFVNGLRLDAGHRVEVYPGSVVVLGKTLLVACNNAEGRQPPEIVATDIDSFVRKLYDVYGSVRRSAQILGVAPATFRRWLRFGRRKKS